jgi:hypothetical protein
MMPLYRKLKAEKYEVLLEETKTEVDPSDFQVMCHMPSQKREVLWRNAIFVPHSVSEYFPYGTEDGKYPFKFKGILSVGPVTDAFHRQHPICLSENVKMVGWPRGDILFNSEKETIAEQLRESLNLPHEKTVLIMCASFGHLQWEIPILNELIPFSKGRFNIIIKERGVKYPDLFSDKDNVKYIPNTEDATPLYLITDLLLSVHPAGSTLVEIAQVNKPSITVNFWGDAGVNKWRYTFLGEADIFCKLGELKSNVTALLESSEEHSPQIREKLERFIYKPDGHATDRGVEALKELMR